MKVPDFETSTLVSVISCEDFEKLGFEEVSFAYGVTEFKFEDKFYNYSLFVLSGNDISIKVKDVETNVVSVNDVQPHRLHGRFTQCYSQFILY